jgi:guanylate kinase
MKPIVYIVSAPSGSGKSTLVNELRKLVPGLDFSISYTTRRPRGSEQNGREYFFVPVADFKRMIEQGEFLEYACVFGNYYGTAKRFLREAEEHGHDLLLDIDVQGAAQIKSQIPDAVSVFILPPDKQTLEWRLRHRSQDAEDVIQKRLVAAAKEIENYPGYDYILINDRLEQSIDELKAIVLSERLRRSQARLSPAESAFIARADGCRLQNIRQRLQPILASFAVSVTSNS